jgi:hypothetical protein
MTTAELHGRAKEVREPTDGRIVAHNHVQPAAVLGMRGFRAWLAEPSDKYEICRCGFAPQVATHYRVARGG